MAIEVVAMAFFRKSELSPVERLEGALKDKQAARQKLADRLIAAEAALTEKRVAAEKAAMAGAADAELDRSEAAARATEDRGKTLRAALVQLDEQIAEAERELAAAIEQRDCDMVADELAGMAAAIAQAAPGFDTAASKLIEAITTSPASMPEASRFAASLDAMRRDAAAAASMITVELRNAAARTRAGQAKIAFRTPEPEKLPTPEIPCTVVYTLSALQWREGTVVRRAPAFAQVDLPKILLPVALEHQHVDHIGSARTQRLMEVYGSGHGWIAPYADAPRLVDLDELAATAQSEEESAEVTA